MCRLLKHFVLLAVVVCSPSAAWAYGGIGCTNLPEYDRAMGALEGMTGACDMTVEQARRIVAEHDGHSAAVRPTNSAPHRLRRLHPARSPQN